MLKHALADAPQAADNEVLLQAMALLAPFYYSPWSHRVLHRGELGYHGIMDLDAKVCYCFHVSRRKLVNFVRQNRPKVASQLSECGGAGTGCGWCIPFLKQIYQ